MRPDPSWWLLLILGFLASPFLSMYLAKLVFVACSVLAGIVLDLQAREAYGYVNLTYLITLRKEYVGPEETVRKTIIAMTNRNNVVDGCPGLGETTADWAIWLYGQKKIGQSN